MKIAELRAKLEALKGNATAILDKVEADGRSGMSAEEQTEFDRLKAEIDKQKAEIEGLERLAEARREMSGTVGRPAMSLGTPGEPDPARTGGFATFSEFCQSVRDASANGRVDRRLTAAAPSNVTQGNGADGEGYLIPTEYRERIWNAVLLEDDLLSRFSPEETMRRSIEFVKDETTPWGAAGITASWRAEGSVMTPDKLATNAARMELHDLYAFAAVTEETLEDAPRLEQHLMQRAPEAIRWKAAEAVVWGNGVGRPQGFMTSPALVTVSEESGQAADTIVAGNVNNMYSRLLAPSQPFWLANRDIFPQLQALNGGGTAPTMLFYPPGGITTAPNGTLLGYPIVYSEHAATLGDLGDLVLIEPRGYMAARKAGGLRFATSIHLWFDYNARAFRWTFRMGGQPLLSAPVSPARGSATKSHFVALEARTG